MKRFYTVMFILIVVSGCFAQGMSNIAKKKGPEFGLKSAGVRVGAVIPSTKYDVTYGISGIVDLGTITDFLAVGAELDYWRAKQHTNGADVFYRGLGGGVSVYYLPAFDWKIKTRVGVGIGVYSYLKDYPDNWDQTDKSEVNPFEPHFEISGDYPLEGDIDITTALRANLSNISAYSIYVGAKFKIKK